MAFGEVDNMDVIANPGAISGWIVIPKDFKRRTFANRNLRNK